MIFLFSPMINMDASRSNSSPVLEELASHPKPTTNLGSPTFTRWPFSKFIAIFFYCNLVFSISIKLSDLYGSPSALNFQLSSLR